MEDIEFTKREAAAEAGELRDASLAWSPGFSHATRRRVIYTALLTASTIAVGLAAVPIAYIMIYSWPASIGDPQRHGLDIIGTVYGVLRMIASPEFDRYLPLFILSPFVISLIAQWFRLHTLNQRALAPFGETFTVLKVTIASVVVLALIGNSFGRGLNEQSQLEIVLFYIYIAALVFLGLLLTNSGAKIANGVLQLRGIGRTNLAVVVNDSAIGLLAELDRNGGAHRYVGSIALEANNQSAQASSIGSVESLEDTINENNIDEIILAIDQGLMSLEQRHEIAQTCWKLGVDLRILPPFHPYFQTTGATEMIAGVPLLVVRRSGLYASRSQFVKRAMDIAVASLVLLATSPVMIVAILAIKLESKGPILFVQKRPGLHGRVFNILKFRSMFADADHRAHQEAQKALIQDGVAAEYDEDGRPIFGKVAADPRITRVGQFIRRTSIDELPQLINVVRGEMSLVGPRPSVLYELENYRDWHMRRLAIRPGITGLWQVSGRSRLSFDEMVELDLHYIENWSLFLDLKILFKTLPAVINVDRAY
jgi:exopolysaccharide biosynthesis polyprenyl glycosylphosphotransferase